MLNIKVLPADKTNYGSKRELSDIQYIVIHCAEDDNNVTEEYFTEPNKKASVHYVIKNDKITKCVNDENVAYSIGGKRLSQDTAIMYGTVLNSNSISIILNDMSELTVSTAMEFISKKMNQLNIKIDNIYRHFDITGKECPKTLVDNKEWELFKEKINEKLKLLYTHNQFVKDVQSALNVKVSGYSNNKTLNATPILSIDKNIKHPVVLPLQKYLNSLGYYNDIITGVFNESTKEAVITFQKSYGDNGDGYIPAKQKCWKKLLKIS